MGSRIKLTASDGHQLGAYLCEPRSSLPSAIVVIQEIFGVNRHIRSIADDYTSQGFWAIAPALFDRVQPDLELDYVSADSARGMQTARQIGLETALLDVAAAIDHVLRVAGVTKVGALGFCWGGTLAWLAATRLKPAAAVCYYGGLISKHAGEIPACPVMLHFGAEDPYIGPSELETIKQAHPELPLLLYDAGHGFNCDQRKDYHPPSATLARQRSLEFFRTYI